MAKREPIVWTKYLTTRALLRAWYVFENNNFKKEIYKTRETTKASYAGCHNALYNGLYFPYEILEKNLALVKIKQQRQLKERSTIANFMAPDEILMNIHAMHDCAQSIKIAGTNVSNTDQYNFCRNAGILNNYINKKINKAKVCAEPEAMIMVQPNCQKYLKKIRKDLKLASFVPSSIFKEDSTQQKIWKFEEAKRKYTAEYNNLLTTLTKITSNKDSQKRILQIIDSAYMGTSLPLYGLDINKTIMASNAHELITRKEVVNNTLKLKSANDFLQENKFSKASELEKELYKNIRKEKLDYIIKNKTYPEVGKGFYNTFASLLSHNLVYQDIKISELTPNIDEEIQEVLLTISKLNANLSKTTDQNEIEKYKGKIQKIKQKLEEIKEISNEQ